MKKKNQKNQKQKQSKAVQTLTCLLTLVIFLHNISAHAREMTNFPRVKLQTLDKATARTKTFEAEVGSTLKFGPLYIKVQSCQKSSPIDQPESSAFVQIWEVPPEEKKTEGKAEWVFSGWMFASSPALSPMDHPIYDVWLMDCLPEKGQTPDIAATPIVPTPIPTTSTVAIPEDPDATPLD